MVVVDSEAWALRQQMAVVRSWGAPCAAFWRGRLGEADWVVARTAPGKVNAALAAQALLQVVRPDLLMSVGTAGAVGDLQVGDVVIADEVGWHDTGLYLGARFVPFGGFVHAEGKGRSVRDGYRLPGDLQEAARAWAARWRRERGEAAPRLLWGKVVTGDQVILSTQRKKYLRERFGALAVEMESTVVVQVASTWGIPWVVVRGISDPADSANGFDFTPWARLRYGEGGMLARARILTAMLGVTLRDPAWPRKQAKVRWGLRLATANATEVALGLALAPEVRQCAASRPAGLG
ncbi:MAG: 5'-methylthioadenosine/S-adenosylhomocysteine nucleosidase [Anaerolineae bacterium]